MRTENVAKEKVPNNFLNSISLAEKTNNKTFMSSKPSRFFETINIEKRNASAINSDFQ